MALPIPPLDSPLGRAAAEAAHCRRCDLWRQATQTVFGEGPPDATMMLIGEGPGDQEDVADRPFVGPAGRLLDRALAEVGVARAEVYVTNAVKHFKFTLRGKRRLPQRPARTEIAACKLWLDVEQGEIRPRVTVLLGTTAAEAVLGHSVTIGRERGQPIALDQGTGVVTVHPSYVLRQPDEATRARAYGAFVADLRLAATLCSG